MAIKVQFLDESDYISHSANNFGKGMNRTILPPTTGKIVRQNGLIILGMATRLGEEKF